MIWRLHLMDGGKGQLSICAYACMAMHLMDGGKGQLSNNHKAHMCIRMHGKGQLSNHHEAHSAHIRPRAHMCIRMQAVAVSLGVQQKKSETCCFDVHIW